MLGPENSSRSGYIYVLINESMPGLVKIGKSSLGGRKRADQIYQTGVPVPFRLYFEMIFSDIDDAETKVHSDLERYRVSPNREFFKMPAGLAADAVVQIWSEYHARYIVDTEDMYALDELKKKADEIGAHPFEVYSCVEDIPANVYRETIDSRYKALGIKEAANE